MPFLAIVLIVLWAAVVPAFAGAVDRAGLVGRLASLVDEPGPADAGPAPEPVVETDPPYRGVDLRDLATRHYYNPFDGILFDRNPYPPELIDDARTMLEWLDHPGTPGVGPGKLSSVRAMGWGAGRIDFLAIVIDGKGRPVYRTGSFHSTTGSVSDLSPIEPEDPSLTIGLKDLALTLRDSSGRFVIVDPIGAGGYRKDESSLLMTPVMRPEVTRTPGRGFLEGSRYRSNYMIGSRTHPEYYEGLPFVRLRRFDRPIDEYAIHGPISTGGTYPIRWGLRGEKLDDLRMLSYQQAVSPSRLLERLNERDWIDDDTRLVRGRVSNGCIRMRARDIREMYAVLGSFPLGAPLEISYRAAPVPTFHPFPWESRRFAIATDEKDPDGLTVMFTGTIRNQAGRNEGALPCPEESLIAQEEARALRSARAVAGSGPRPADLARLLERSRKTARALRALARPVRSARR